MRRYAGWLVVLALVGVGLAYLTRPKPPLEVQVVHVERGGVKEIVPSSASGEVRPARRVTVRSELAGTVAKVAHRRGERVVEKERMVSFRSEELEARLSQAKANLEAAAIACKMAVARKDAARRAAERARKLHAGGAIADAEAERAETELIAAEQGVLQSEASQKQIQAALDLATITRDRAQVSAPFPGVLQDVYAEVGVQLSPGAPLFDLIDDATVHVDIPVDEADAAKIFVGQTVELRTDAQRGEVLGGKVRFIPPAIGKSAPTAPGLEPDAIPARRDRAIYAEIAPDDPARFRIGASVNAEFLVRQKDGVLFVPTHVVIGRGAEREVYLAKGGKAARITFQPGITSWERTEIVSGLAEGDLVIANLNAKDLGEGVAIEAHPLEPSPSSASHAGR
jgi:HlyD family secretion protein